MRRSVVSLMCSLIALVLFGVVNRADAYTFGQTWSSYVWAGDVVWKFYSTPMDWHSAQRHCQREGAYLAIANSGPKHHKLMRKLEKDAWIGLSRAGSGWKWIDGNMGSNLQWFTGQPRGGDCVYSSKRRGQDGKWFSENCSRRLPFVCEAKNKCVDKNPCKNGGKCGGKGRVLACTCPPGFQGSDCDQDKRPCFAFNPCKQGAHCNNRGTDYTCSCPAGFAGKNCEQDKRPCFAFNPCKQGAHCNNRGTDYTCSCPAGFAGKNCEQDKRPCFAFNPCKHGSKCSNRGLDYSCACPAGFLGKSCEQDKRPCIAFNPCQHGAKCSNRGLDYSCACPAGFAGKSCEQDKRPCIAFNPCNHGAKCSNRGLDYSCACPAGFAGKSCEQDKRPCLGFNPCKNGAHCSNKGTDYHCECLSGFKGKNCETACALMAKGGLPEKLDIIFLIDGSRSVGKRPFIRGLEFINKIIKKMDISPSKARVGFIQYSKGIDRTQVIDFKQSTALGKSKLIETISKTAYMDAYTNIVPALDEAISIFKNQGRSKDVVRYMMVLSDGESHKVNLLPAAMKKIKDAKIQTFSIGVGEMAKTEKSRKQLLDIAQGNGRHVFEVDNYDQLNESLFQKVMVSQCD